MIKRKKLSWSVGLLSIFLAIVWIGIIFVGMVQENERSGLKEAVGQQVNYELSPSLKPESSKMIAIVIDDSSGDVQIDKLIGALPNNVTFGLSPYNKFIHKNIASLIDNNREFLVNIPLVSQRKNSKKLDLFPTLNEKDIMNRIDNINDLAQGSVGFYSSGNDDFLKREGAVEATVKKIYDLKSALFYGIKNNTSVLESEDGVGFKIAAFDVEVSDNNKETGLQDLETMAESKGIALGLIKISDLNIIEIKNWLDSLKRKNIEIVSVNKLWQKKDDYGKGA